MSNYFPLGNLSYFELISLLEISRKITKNRELKHNTPTFRGKAFYQDSSSQIVKSDLCLQVSLEIQKITKNL